MSDQLLDYYKNYYKREDGSAYTMEGHKDTSRVLQLIDWIKQHTQEGAQILDIGCGDAYLSTQIGKRNYTGLDINTEKASDKPGVLLTHDVMAAPYPIHDKVFDLIVNSETMEHVWDMRVVHKEAHRLLKPGGYYIVTTPNFNWIDHYFSHFSHLLWDPVNRSHTSEHIRQYNYIVHEEWLTKAGFKIIDFTGADAHYSQFMQDARSQLYKLLLDLGHEEYRDQYGKVDQILGRMFSAFSHTICLLAQKV